MMTYNPALGVVPMHWRTTTVLYLWTSLLWISLLVDFTFVDFTMWTTPDGKMYVCMWWYSTYTLLCALMWNTPDGNVSK